jgi:hypothetical protein
MLAPLGEDDITDRVPHVKAPAWGAQPLCRPGHKKS